MKELPPGTWELKVANGSQIPYIINSESGKKKWAMEIFQATQEAPENIEQMPNLNLDDVVEANGEEAKASDKGATTQPPMASMNGMTPGLGASNLFHILVNGHLDSCQDR